ncbi:MAG: divergent polysaccharide deacetylase family protein [Thermoanaerobaculum sp.]|nr:divergent polysaccharide deacetylase family protein [Thermoanaerobaculum sp.]
MLALLLLVGVAAGLAWLVGRGRSLAKGDPQRLEQAVREVLERHQISNASLTWERKGRQPLLAVQVSTGQAMAIQRLALELEAALHNLGGRLEPLPLLERGGYAQAAWQGTLGQARLRLVVIQERPRSVPPPARKARAVRPGKLAVVLDDAGHSEQVLPLLQQLPPEVAVAVLPNAPASRVVAEQLRAEGREVLLHMPMEPEGNGHPGLGEGAVMVGMDAQQVAQVLEQALEVVGPVTGVNNHMGSRATADRQLMGDFFHALAPRGFYFLDSRTTPASVAAEVAQEKGVPSLQRDVFLDVVEDEGAIRSALATVASLARSQGHAVAIGHVHPLTLRVLAEQLPRLEGVELVRPSALVR